MSSAKATEKPMGFRSPAWTPRGQQGQERGETSGDSTMDSRGELNDFIYERNFVIYMRETLQPSKNIRQEVTVKGDFSGA